MDDIKQAASTSLTTSTPQPATSQSTSISQSTSTSQLASTSQPTPTSQSSSASQSASTSQTTLTLQSTFTSHTTSTLAFRLPLCNKITIDKIIEELDGNGIEWDTVDDASGNAIESSEVESSGSSLDSINSVTNVGDVVDESHELSFDMLKKDFKILDDNAVELACLRSSTNFYKQLLEYLFHTCDKKKRIRLNYKVRYLSASLLLRCLKITHDWNGGAPLNETTKKIDFTMIYHCINISTCYVTNKPVFTMEGITERAKKYGYHTNASDMKEMEEQLLEDLFDKLIVPNIYTFLEAMLPLTCLKKKLSLPRFLTKAALVMDFFYVHFIEILTKYYDGLRTRKSERTYTLEDFPLLIAASVIYATFDKFYSKESLIKLFIETLADLVNLSGYTRGQLYIFSDALLGTIDRHEIDTKYFMCLSKTL